ncbi:unnamed protein product [Symbiodinium sp. KB8]|nr:unnamed protein product [Symbiodinium sp. KB8]
MRLRLNGRATQARACRSRHCCQSRLVTRSCLGKGEADLFGQALEVVGADGSSSDHVLWLHRTVRTYAERLEPTSTLLDSEWICRSEDADQAVREIIVTVAAAAARGARMTTFASQWLGKLPTAAAAANLVEAGEVTYILAGLAAADRRLGEAKAESLRRWKGTKSELMEVFQMISGIAGLSALPSRSRQVVLEEMREKRPDWVSTLQIPEPFTLAELFRLNPWFRLVEEGSAWTIIYVFGVPYRSLTAIYRTGDAPPHVKC